MSKKFNPGVDNPGVDISRSERAVAVALASVYGFGGLAFSKVLAKFGSLQQVWKAGEVGLLEAGLSEGLVGRVLERRCEIEPLGYLEFVEELGVSCVVYGDEEYPAKLAEISSAPYVLFARGEFVQKDELAVAIVGTRKPSSYGRRMAYQIAGELADAGVCVVSGLAYGVDQIAHKAVVENEGRAIAVLGNGIDRVQPAASVKLAERIVGEGLGVVMSEYPPGFMAAKQNFPARNRIVSGLSTAVLVVEGTSRSGTLITAEFAREQGRRLLAVPGEVGNPLAEAPNGLINGGALLVRGAGDVLAALGIDKTEKKKLDLSKLSGEEKAVYESIEKGKDLTSLARELEMSVGKVSSLVTMMEIEGLVVVDGGVVSRV